jgi:hypothetical protein
MVSDLCLKLKSAVDQTLSMKSFEPTITDPTGAPNPLNRHT